MTETDRERIAAIIERVGNGYHVPHESAAKDVQFLLDLLASSVSGETAEPKDWHPSAAAGQSAPAARKERT